jgi:hypothetical protein
VENPFAVTCSETKCVPEHIQSLSISTALLSSSYFLNHSPRAAAAVVTDELDKLHRSLTVFFSSSSSSASDEDVTHRSSSSTSLRHITRQEKEVKKKKKKKKSRSRR